MKFLGNMGISPLTIAFLRAQGHEAKHLHEEGTVISVTEGQIRVRHLPLS